MHTKRPCVARNGGRCAEGKSAQWHNPTAPNQYLTPAPTKPNRTHPCPPGHAVVGRLEHALHLGIHSLPRAGALLLTHSHCKSAGAGCEKTAVRRAMAWGSFQLQHPGLNNAHA